jgi:predicted O-methyltransferase YrrM
MKAVPNREKSMSSLHSKKVTAVLDKLFARAEAEDGPLFERIRADAAKHGRPFDDNRDSGLLAEAFMPVDQAAGRFLYSLARARGNPLIVEFGTSFGISTIYLAAAARDSGGGRVVTTEKEPGKVKSAREHIEEAGLSDHVEVREGDALETLRDLDGPVDLLFLDGWKSLYLPVLKLLEPRLRPGAAVIGDDLRLFPEQLQPYLDRVRNPENDYVSVEIPIGDGMELSTRI